MKIPENLNAITDKNFDIYFEIHPNIKPVSSNKWIYHKIEAFTDINSQKTNIGYITIAYIDEELKNKYCNDILNYLINNNYIEFEDKSLNLEKLNIENLRKIGSKMIYGKIDNIDDKDILNMLKMKLKINESKYISHLKYHYLKPEPHYIDVFEDYRRKGVAVELYKIASEFCSLNGLNMYQSLTQTPEANAVWSKMKKTIPNINLYTFNNYENKEKERYYIGNHKPILDFNTDFSKINMKKLKSKSKGLHFN